MVSKVSRSNDSVFLFFIGKPLGTNLSSLINLDGIKFIKILDCGKNKNCFEA